MTEDQKPSLRVVSGDPTPEELAAIVTVIAAAASASGDSEPTPSVSGWGAPSGMHRAAMPAPGQGSWQRLGQR